MKKSLKKNSTVYKQEIKEKLFELRKSGDDPDGIKVNADGNFKEWLVIEASPGQKKSKRKATIETEERTKTKWWL